VRLCVQAVHPCAACCAQQSLCAALQPPAVQRQGRCDRQAAAALGATQARHQGPEEQTQGATGTQGRRAPATETKNNISSCLAVESAILCSCKEHHGLRSVGRPQHKHDHQPLSFEPLLLKETRTRNHTSCQFCPIFIVHYKRQTCWAATIMDIIKASHAARIAKSSSPQL
jgi:hypothetical protein